MDIIRKSSELRQVVEGCRVALVPTMGGLHEGHLSLVRTARTLAQKVIVSIYVNPLQFGEEEDYADYPRCLSEDCEKLQGLADIVYAPSNAEMYPEKQTITIALPQFADELCGASRPGFFQGVATVVCKLFNQTKPDVAVFGQKDYQQFCVVQQLVRQLAMPVDIVLHPTVREEDGLAMSSRNLYLTEAERRDAPLLYAALQEAAAAIARGADIGSTCAACKAAISEAKMRCDYVVVRTAERFLPPEQREGEENWVLLAAAWLGKTRLIDNIKIPIKG